MSLLVIIYKSFAVLPLYLTYKRAVGYLGLYLNVLCESQCDINYDKRQMTNLLALIEIWTPCLPLGLSLEWNAQALLRLVIAHFKHNWMFLFIWFNSKFLPHLGIFSAYFMLIIGLFLQILFCQVCIEKLFDGKLYKTCHAM